MNQSNNKLHYFFDGFVLSIQFLTVLPLNKEIPWDRERARMSVRTFPLVGIMLGLLLALQAYLLIEYSPFSMLAIAFWLFFFSVIFTGGLHLDGWIDCSDAYFSYRDRERRLEIMKDSRVGAFGVLSVLFLLGWRFLFLYEVLLFSYEYIYLVLVIIPFFSRIVMGVVLIYGKLARNEGMAYAFRKHVSKKDISYYFIYLILLFIGFIFLLQFEVILVALFLLISSVVFYFIYVRFITWAFGGVTGDSLGASVEGGEAVLWLIMWLLLYFVMG
ncbi:adenosylcobinamide-GDP ribazoletransferase [Anaerobacillus sp. MEB173]|uniref:adenosylcobinamide-GDP ribazoletransferase n=1 Tax=Anaerobacillus sp. MEB173 TaxID=3383345 RepID=UPI003F8DF9A9